MDPFGDNMNGNNRQGASDMDGGSTIEERYAAAYN
jgi:hypothetical protein